MRLWTDYPITGLGDIPGQLAPIREVQFISYDGDKYCRVRVENHEVEIKAGYLYTELGRSMEVPSVPITYLEREAKESDNETQ